MLRSPEALWGRGAPLAALLMVLAASCSDTAADLPAARRTRPPTPRGTGTRRPTAMTRAAARARSPTAFPARPTTAPPTSRGSWSVQTEPGSARSVRSRSIPASAGTRGPGSSVIAWTAARP